MLLEMPRILRPDLQFRASVSDSKNRPQRAVAFSEPKNARQKWHVKRSDFYVNEEFVSSVCSPVGEFKSGGSTIPVAEADALDPRFCSYCLQIVSDGGQKWVLSLAPREGKVSAMEPGST
jgi:hypothetical protein